MQTNPRAQRSTRWRLWLLLFLTMAIALAVVAIPVAVIMPFKSQTPAGVEWSYLLRRWSPWVTVATAVAGIWIAIRLWSGGRWWTRLILVAMLAPIFLAAWFARQNHFEWMFRPLPNAAYATAGEARHVADNDMVMAVNVNGEAVAYPVRQMAYHHIVNDVAGGKPITATY